jgi:hypothetical protein
MDQALKNYATETFPKYEKEDTGKDILDGKMDPFQKTKVCEIKKNKFCLATSSCPDSKKDEKKFFVGHSILYYVNKDDPRGSQPKNPENDPQFKNWEKAVQKWAVDQKDIDKEDVPADSCKSEDFGTSASSVTVSISSPNDGDTLTGSTIPIKAAISANLEIKKITLYINGNEITSSTDSSFSYNYSTPSGENAIDIRVTAEDKDGNTASDGIRINTSI